MNQDIASAARLEKLVPLLRSDPDNLPLHRECMELAMRGREYARALDLVDARLTRHPVEAESLYSRTNALIGLGRHAEALVILKQLEDQGVSLEAVWQNLATCHFKLEQFENARAYAEKLLAATSPSANTLFIALTSLHQLGEMDEAVKLADAHAEFAESDGTLAGAYALMYLDAEQTPKAIKFADIALVKNPDNICGLLVKASEATAELDTEVATRQYSRVLELSPEAGRAWLGIGLLTMLSGDYAKAQEQLARATQLMPTHLGSWHSLAWAHFFAQDLAGAEKYFAHALKLDRTFGESHGAMAAMHAIKGDIASAEREIEIAERLDRRGGSAQFARAMLVARSQGPEASRQFIRTAVRALATRASGKPRDVLMKLTDFQQPS
jgi:tetratricopeptide (TPR) repeat protein